MDPITGITATFDPTLTAALPWASLVSKMLVDYARSNAELPKWASPLLSLLFSVLLLLLSVAAAGVSPTVAVLAQVVLAGFACAALAIGATTLQARTVPNSQTAAREAVAKLIADELERRLKATPSRAA